LVGNIKKQTDKSDRELIAAIQQGDKESFKQLQMRYSSRIWYYIKHKASIHQHIIKRAEMLDVFVKRCFDETWAIIEQNILLKKVNPCDKRAKISTYIFEVAKRHFMFRIQEVYRDSECKPSLRGKKISNKNDNEGAPLKRVCIENIQTKSSLRKFVVQNILNENLGEIWTGWSSYGFSQIERELLIHYPFKSSATMVECQNLLYLKTSPDQVFESSSIDRLSIPLCRDLTVKELSKKLKISEKNLKQKARRFGLKFQKIFLKKKEKEHSLWLIANL
jgi:hypothetical protein